MNEASGGVVVVVWGLKLRQEVFEGSGTLPPDS